MAQKGIREFDVNLTGFNESEIENLMTQYHVPVTLEEIGEKLASYAKTGPRKSIVISFGKFVSPVKKGEGIDEMGFIQKSEEIVDLGDEKRRLVALDIAKYIIGSVEKWLNSQ